MNKAEELEFLKDAEKWDNRELGAEEKTARVVKGSGKELDRALGRTMISLRLPVQLVEDYKTIAADAGIGYQPLMRDILIRFAQHEMEARKHRTREEQRQQSIDLNLRVA